MKKLVFTIALAFASIAGGNVAVAHSGGTADDGCHYDHKRGGRHCH